MDKINLKKTKKILFGISILIIIISIIIGLAISIDIGMRIENMPEINIDNSDFSSALKVFGYMALPVVLGASVIICILIALIIDSIIWAIYGVIKLIIEKRWKVFIITGIVVGSIVLICIIYNIIAMPRFEENTIGSIAYDYNSNLDYTIYIKENDKYMPYLVLTYDYNNTNNALCLRKNVVGGENGYIEDYNGTIAKAKVYDGWVKMQNHFKYQETNVDKYLNGDFKKKFDSNLLDNIYDTELSFSECENGNYNNYEINRKFFILSLTELNYDLSFDNKTKNKMKLKYFDNNNLTTVNDIGVKSPYWTRTFDPSKSFYIVGYNGGVTITGTDAKFGVRPAFTISNKTKIKEVYDKELMQDIYVLDI